MPAAAHQDEDATFLQGEDAGREGLLRLVQIVVHGIGGHGDHHIGRLGYLHHELAVRVCDRCCKGGPEFSRVHRRQFLVAIQDELHGVDALGRAGFLQQAEGLKSVLVHGIAAQGERRGARFQGQPVIGLDAFEGRHAGEQGFSPPVYPAK